eukprot:4138261-Pyramimonas_sp.AAC.1
MAIKLLLPSPFRSLAVAAQCRGQSFSLVMVAAQRREPSPFFLPPPRGIILGAYSNYSGDSAGMVPFSRHTGAMYENHPLRIQRNAL